jgi:hypothetical protein
MKLIKSVALVLSLLTHLSAAGMADSRPESSTTPQIACSCRPEVVQSDLYTFSYYGFMAESAFVAARSVCFLMANNIAESREHCFDLAVGIGGLVPTALGFCITYVV